MSKGIYCIRNKVNNKCYVGMSINIERRWLSHKYSLVKKDRNKKNTNRHLYNAVQKYGIDNFVLSILEIVDTLDDDILRQRELVWMDKLNSCEREFGYNLRRDSSSNMTVHAETKLLLSIVNMGEGNPNFGNRWSDEQKAHMSTIAKDRHLNSNVYGEEWKSKISIASSKTWENTTLKDQMADKVSKSKSKYKFYQYDLFGELVNIWNSSKEIQICHPDYHIFAIYGVCSGTKKSYRGFIWKKELKI